MAPIHTHRPPELWRASLPHQVPPWLEGSAVYLITACTTPRHQNQLARDRVFADLLRSWQLHSERAEWEAIAGVAMPDHFHVLARMEVGTDITRMVGCWRRLIARRHHVTWQRGYFEHRLRADEHVDVKREYLRQNPARAGLVGDPKEWPYLWTAW